MPFDGSNNGYPAQPGYPSANGYPTQGNMQVGYPQAGPNPAGAPVNPSSGQGQFAQQPYQGAQGQYRQAGQVTPIQMTSAEDHADKKYGKGAKRGGCWRVAFFIAMTVLLTAAISLGYIIFTYWQGQHEYDEIAEHMTVDDSDGVLTLGSFNVDWAALKAINPDVVGWVYVPDTVINYPVVWKENDDKFYLKHNFGQNSAGDYAADYGCPFLSGYNNPNFTDQVNVIFGHNIRNGAMFSALGNVNTDSDYFNAHRTVYILTPAGNFKTTTFAVNKVLGASTDILIPNFPTEEEFRQYIQQRIDDSLVIPNPPPPPLNSIDQVFVYSTCNLPDATYRIITIAYIEEYLPADKNPLESGTIVSEDSVSNVEDMMTDRTR